MDNSEANGVEEKIEKNTKQARRNVNSTKRRVNVGLIVTAIVLTIVVIAIVVFALINKLNKNVYSNVYFNGINLSGKTNKEVTDIIASLNKTIKDRSVLIKHENEQILELTADNIEMELDEQATLNEIMNFGRKDNIITNNFVVLKTLFKAQNIQPVYKYSDTKLTAIALEITSGIEGRVKDDSFKLLQDNYTLEITRGTSGKDIVMTEFKADILELLKQEDVKEYTIDLETRKPTQIDVDVVYAKIHKDAKDAYIDETINPPKCVKHEVGITFDKEELRKLLEKEENKAEGKKITFKLTVTQPKVKIQDITKDMYKDILGTHTSSYVNSDANRASNVALGASMLNGTIVMPGETFSFNKVMGDCGLSSRGFKVAAVFKGGAVAQEVGGGICQISSTLYIAVLRANLSIVTRHNHALPVGYVPASLDATVYYPSTDFKFKNTRDYPIKIVATTSSKKLTISITGTKEEKEYDIELTSSIIESVPSKVVEKKTDTLEKGKTMVSQSGSSGYKSVAYKITRYNGKIISKELLSQDTYNSTPKIILVGTKENVNNNTQEPNVPTVATPQD